MPRLDLHIPHSTQASRRSSRSRKDPLLAGKSGHRDRHGTSGSFRSKAAHTQPACSPWKCIDSSPMFSFDATMWSTSRCALPEARSCKAAGGRAREGSRRKGSSPSGHRSSASCAASPPPGKEPAVPGLAKSQQAKIDPTSAEQSCRSPDRTLPTRDSHPQSLRKSTGSTLFQDIVVRRLRRCRDRKLPCERAHRLLDSRAMTPEQQWPHHCRMPGPRPNPAIASLGSIPGLTRHRVHRQRPRSKPRCADSRTMRPWQHRKLLHPDPRKPCGCCRGRRPLKQARFASAPLLDFRCVPMAAPRSFAGRPLQLQSSRSHLPRPKPLPG
eukprot:s556_g2.t1